MPQALGFLAATGCVFSSELSANQAISASVSAANGVSVPARQAYSHCASVGSEKVPRPCVPLLRRRTNSWQSFQLTLSTG